MERHHAHRHRRRGRLAALIPLTIGAIALLAASLPASTPHDAGPNLSADAHAAVDAGSRLAAATARPGSGRELPIVERAATASHAGRPTVTVSQPKAGVEARAIAGGKAVFLGDSYTTGMAGEGVGARGWPRLVGRARHWQTVNLAVAGTGFINPGWTNQPVGSRVAAAIRQKPDIVFLASGHNDSRWSAAATGRAADQVIDRLHRALPKAVLVILAPIWSNGSPPQRCLDLRDHLRRKAASIGAVFIDPLAGRWFAGSAQRFIGPDGIHPTDAGHRRIADFVLAGISGIR